MDDNVIDAIDLFSPKRPIVNNAILTTEDFRAFFKVLSRIKEVSDDSIVNIAIDDEAMALTFNEDYIVHDDLDIEDALSYVTQSRQSTFLIPVDWEDSEKSSLVNATMLFSTLLKAFTENNEE